MSSSIPPVSPSYVPLNSASPSSPAICCFPSSSSSSSSSFSPSPPPAPAPAPVNLSSRCRPAFLSNFARTNTDAASAVFGILLLPYQIGGCVARQPVDETLFVCDYGGTPVMDCSANIQTHPAVVACTIASAFIVLPFLYWIFAPLLCLCALPADSFLFYIRYLNYRSQRIVAHYAKFVCVYAFACLLTGVVYARDFNTLSVTLLCSMCFITLSICSSSLSFPTRAYSCPSSLSQQRIACHGGYTAGFDRMIILTLEQIAHGQQAHIEALYREKTGEDVWTRRQGDKVDGQYTRERQEGQEYGVQNM